MIYAHTYQPGQTMKTDSGWQRITILSLGFAKTLGVEIAELATPEEAMKLIETADIQMVSFGLFGLPRHPVPVTHARLGQYVRRMFKVKIAGCE